MSETPPPPEGEAAAPPPEGEAASPPPERRKPRKPRQPGEPRKGFRGFALDWCKAQGLGLPRHLYEMADWLGSHWWRRALPKRLLLLAFRGAGKSTLVGLFAAWLIKKKPDIRILTLSADLALARKMVRNVKRIVEKHPTIPRLKPAKPELWGAEQFTVRREAELRDPTMLARGVDGNFTGSRADVVICDDVEVPGNADTPAKRAALRERLGEIEFVLVPGGMQLYIGTPHSWYSIYADAPREGETRPFLDGFARKSVPIRDEDGDPAWPDRYGKEQIAEIERAAGPLRFRSQMMLQPLAPRQCRLDAGKLARYDGEVEYREARGQGSLWLEGRRLASLRVWWDPAYGRSEKSSRNVIAAVYQDVEGGYWLHRVHYFGYDAALAAEHPETHAEIEQLCREAARFAKALEAPAITVEDNGIGKFVPSLLRKALKTVDPGIAVLARHSRVPKDERILGAFDATLAGGLLHAHGSVVDGPFLEELREWQPEGKAGRPDDGLDAVAGAILAEPVRLGPFPRAPGRHGAWRPAARPYRAETDFQP
jgi:hypothetical protein